MINVDISNIWGQVTLPNLLAMEAQVAAAHEALMNPGEDAPDAFGWLDLPDRADSRELSRIRSTAQRIRAESDVCVVLGVGGTALGARAAIEALQGSNRNLGKGKGDPVILFAGNSLSTRAWEDLQRQLEGKDVSLILISKSGTTLEPSIAFRGLRWMLERKYGTDGANRRIYAITDPRTGALRQEANEEGWESFLIPSNVGGRFCVLTAAGLLPMAVAGLDIEALLAGAREVRECSDLRSFENPVWLYAAVRNLLHRSGKDIELFTTFEPGMKGLSAWWQQLFAQSEGKQGKGLFPAAAEFTGDLHGLGQLIQQGKRNLFETMVRFDAPQIPYVIDADWKGLDGLNYLEGKRLDFVEDQAALAAISAHVDGGVSVITMDCGPLNEASLGGLFYFLQLSCAISAGILGVEPYGQPGVALYRKYLYELLGKPGYDSDTAKRKNPL